MISCFSDFSTDIPDQSLKLSGVYLGWCFCSISGIHLSIFYKLFSLVRLEADIRFWGQKVKGQGHTGRWHAELDQVLMCLVF